MRVLVCPPNDLEQLPDSVVWSLHEGMVSGVVGSKAGTDGEKHDVTAHVALSTL